MTLQMGIVKIEIKIPELVKAADDVKFQVSSDDGSTYKYWNGSAWTNVTTTGSYAQAAT